MSLKIKTRLKLFSFYFFFFFITHICSALAQAYPTSPENADICAFDDFLNKYHLSKKLVFTYPSLIARFGEKAKCMQEFSFNFDCIKNISARANRLAIVSGKKAWRLPELRNIDVNTRYQFTWFAESGKIKSIEFLPANRVLSNQIDEEPITILKRINAINDKLCSLSSIDDNDFERAMKPYMWDTLRESVQ